MGIRHLVSVLLLVVMSDGLYRRQHHGHEFSASLLKPYDQTASMMFHSIDHDGDGIVTKLNTEATFHKYDSNGNGELSRHEYTDEICDESPQLYQLAHYLYDEFDYDNDHVLEQHDFDTFFDRIDDNGDGQLTEIEYIAFFTAIFTKYESITIHGHSNPNSVCHHHHHG